MTPQNSDIVCPQCQTLNRAGAKKCRQCGAALPQTLETQRVTPPSPETRRVAPPIDAPENTHRLDQDGGVPTVRLPSPAFAELPLGAIVNHRFEVFQVFSASPQENTYLASDANSPQQCVLYESSNPKQYECESKLLAHQVKHPALVNVVDVAQAKFGEATRAYVALEFPIAAALPRDLSEVEVLEWGVQLADALKTLHQAGLAHGNIQPANLVVSNNQIKLWGYTHISPLAPETRARDLQQFMAMLGELLRPLGKVTPTTATFLQQRYPDAATMHAGLTNAWQTVRHPAMLTTTVGRLSDVGQKREVDEDSLLTTELVQFTQTGTQVWGLYAVADGMGGASAGELASRLATESLAREVTEKILTPHFKGGNGTPDYGALLKSAVVQANADVFAERQRLQNNMGTTLVAALLVGTTAYVVNVGDSRAYLVTPDKIKKITKDHSLVQTLVDRQQITEDQVRTHPQRNFILRNVGDKPKVEADLFTETVAPGDYLLLCCDGLWELVPNDEALRQIILANPAPQDAARKLIETANANGGDDNITCVLVRLDNARGAQ